MDGYIKDLQSAAEHYAEVREECPNPPLKEGEYLEFCDMITGYHSKSREGMIREREERERQMREDEAEARRIASIPSTEGIPGRRSRVGNVMLYSDYEDEYEDGVLYHKVRPDGVHTVRNPSTGIWVILGGPRGELALSRYGLTPTVLRAMIQGATP